MSDRSRPTLPKHSQLALPLLEALAEEGGAASPAAVYGRLSDRFSLPKDVLDLTIPAGGGSRESRFHHRVRWVRQDALRKGYLRAAKRGLWELTPLGSGKLRNVRPGLVVTVFETDAGAALWAQAEDAAAVIEPGSVDLIYTSPPYPLLKPKAYGNLDSAAWLAWMTELARLWKPLLGAGSSLVVNLGAVGERNRPTQDPYIERFTLRLIDELGFSLVDRLYMRNPQKLPTPRLWAAIRRVRLKGDVEPLLWFSPDGAPKSDNRRVLKPYADATLSNRDRARDAAWAEGSRRRTSGAVVSERIYEAGEGAIPGVVIDGAPEGPNSAWRRACRTAGLEAHPAISPRAPIETLIKLTTEPGDLVYDPFAGSLITARVAEDLDRRWLASERSLAYLEAGRLRFGDGAAL